MKDKEVLNLSLPANLSYMPVVLAYIREIARKTGFSDDEAGKIVLATDEAAVNVIQHAFLPEQEATFDITCEVSSLGLKVIVKDKGYPFSPDKVKQYSVEKALEGSGHLGLGLFLMRQSVDELSFHNMGCNGKEVHLVKYIHQKRIEDYVDKSELKPYEQPKAVPEKPIKKTSYHTQLLDSEQSIEISQCAYRTYGYNYIHEYIYYPERIAEMNRKGELISAVAMADGTNEIMSHAALEVTYGKNLVELGIAFTKPEFRNQGCFNQICEYLMDRGKKEGIKGVYATAVTIHPFSQKAILKNKFKECGIMLGIGPATMFKDSLEHGVQRESMVVLFRNIDQSLTRPLHAPRHHRGILEKIYANIEIPVQWKDASGLDKRVLSESAASMETRLDRNMGMAEIYVNEYGANVIEEIRQRLRELDHEKVEAIYLYLDLCDPFTGILAKDFEEMGFFFSGALPSGNRQDLLLQYLNDIQIDYSKICIASDFANELLAYVKASSPAGLSK
jgi:serine/threonine-protein kinase RsbW